MSTPIDRAGWSGDGDFTQHLLDVPLADSDEVHVLQALSGG